MEIKEFYDEATFTLTYVVFDEISKDAIIIDPVLNYEPQSSQVSYFSVEQLLNLIKKEQLNVHYILETHAHADHITSAHILKGKIPRAKTAIHENIKSVQALFKDVFNLGDDFDTEGGTFDLLLADNEVLQAGTLNIKVIHTPGHTPACVSYLVNKKALFVGDAIFMPDFGTGRCDFPKGSAEDLYHSIHEKIYKLPNPTEIYVGHDYQPGGRPLGFKTTVGEEKKSNIQLKEETTQEEFVAFRKARDRQLMAPKLLLASIQVNIQNGLFPKKEDNGVSYLRIPVKGLD